ncbi:hypothetical protein D3C77_812580 [compost metagenome]
MIKKRRPCMVSTLLCLQQTGKMKMRLPKDIAVNVETSLGGYMKEMSVRNVIQKLNLEM